MVPLFTRWLFVSICIMSGVLVTLNLNKSASLTKADSRNLKTGPEAVRLWFFALECDKPHLEFMAKQAVLSAKHYTDLVPILMLHCRNEALEEWMGQHGVTIVDPRNSKIVRMLDANPQKLASVEPLSWHRFSIPNVLDELILTKHKVITKMAEQNPNLLEYALFTDASVVFTNNLVIHPSMLPRYFALPIQGDALCCGDNPYIKQIHSNAGVMLMNITSYREIEEEFSDFVLKHITSNHGTNFTDQAAMHEFFPVRMKSVTWSQWLHMGVYYTTYFKLMYTKYYSDTLPKEFSWEPYLGYNPAAVIVHWHGPSVYVDTCDQLNVYGSTSGGKSKHSKHNSAATTSTTPITTTSTISTTSTTAIATTSTTTATTKSVFTNPHNLVLQQLLLHDLTAPYIPHTESRTTGVYTLPTTVNLRTAYTTPDTPTTHTSANTQYPPVYDWYSHMQLTNEEKALVLSNLGEDETGFLTLTSSTLDGYHYATSLYFAYMNIICSH